MATDEIYRSGAFVLRSDTNEEDPGGIFMVECRTCNETSNVVDDNRLVVEVWTVNVASDTADHSIQGQTVTDTDTGGQTYARTYTYDNTGRLTQADDTAPDGSCTRRGYFPWTPPSHRWLRPTMSSAIRRTAPPPLVMAG